MNTSSPSLESGFSSVNLVSPSENMMLRRNSNSSIASDVSFLPRYESSTSMYHLQSDPDISASEIEDNASSSSQLGHLTKEQLYAAFQKAQMRYHKYRGRFTDLAKHYKELERENGKMKSVLVETQDKAIRRIGELKEQCNLEQKAKAHLENALRVELDEKQYKIDALNTKIELLQTCREQNTSDAEKMALDGELRENLEKQLNEVQEEVSSLNEKLQETKANAIIFQSKENDYRSKISGLEKLLTEVSEREKENNLKLAQSKMELHNEINSKDAEIGSLKKEIEALKTATENVSTKGNSKVDNLQSQNKKLIEKVESLTQKCNNYESDLLKVEHYKIEIQNLNSSVSSLKQTVADMTKEKEQLKKEVANCRSYQKEVDELAKLRDDLQSRLKENADNLNKILQEKQKLEADLEESKSTDVKAKEEINGLLQEISSLKQQLENHNRLVEENSSLTKALADQKKEFDDKITAHRDETKSGLLKLESKIHDKYKTEFAEKESLLKNQFEAKLSEISSNTDNLKETRLKLLEKEEQIGALDAKLEESERRREKTAKDYADLERNHLELINESAAQRNEIAGLNKAIASEKKRAYDLDMELSSFKEEFSGLNSFVADLELEKEKLEEELYGDRHDMDELRAELRSTVEKSSDYESELLACEDAIGGLELNCGVGESLAVKVEEIANRNRLLEEDLRRSNELAEKLRREVEEREVLLHENERLARELQQFKNNATAAKKQQSEDFGEQLRDLEKDKASLHAQLNNLLASVEVGNGEKRNLEAELEKMKAEHTSKEKRNLEEMERLKAIEAEYAAILDENHNLKEQVSQVEYLRAKVAELESSGVNFKVQNETLKKDIEKLRGIESRMAVVSEEISILQKYANERDELEAKNKRLQQKLGELNSVREDCARLEETNKQLADEICRLQSQLRETLSDKQTLSGTLNRLKAIEMEHSDCLAENERLKNTCGKLNEELDEIKRRNAQIFSDNRSVTEENQLLVAELEEMKVKLEHLRGEESAFEEIKARCVKERDSLASNLEETTSELRRLETENRRLQSLQANEDSLGEKCREYDELKRSFGELCSENKSLREEANALRRKREEHVALGNQQKQQLQELENQYTELLHEKQLLQDEVNELKISPINSNNSNNQLNNIDEDKCYAEEITRLRDKITKYKSLDLTNRSSIEFYENELQKLRIKNEKLNRKLDETLVTLNHCAELSNSTEIEYLKNVLYNYMLGKESLVLARVIAAVCKFDQQQTEIILQKEQQKQTLLGQLGIL